MLRQPRLRCAAQPAVWDGAMSSSVPLESLPTASGSGIRIAPAPWPARLSNLGAMTPGDLHEAVETAVNNRNVDALVALYEQDAWLFGPAGPVQGTEAIRAAWTEMLNMSGQSRLVTQYVIEQGDVALLSNRWTSVVGEDEISATSAEVARRQSDGTWKYLIDNPDSAGVLAG